MERKRFSTSLDFAIGAGHSREHEQNFGLLGLSVRVESDLTWKFTNVRQLVGSYEYDYNQFNPAVQDSSSKAWSMMAVKMSFQWALSRRSQ